LGALLPPTQLVQTLTQEQATRRGSQKGPRLGSNQQGFHLAVLDIRFPVQRLNTPDYLLGVPDVFVKLLLRVYDRSLHRFFKGRLVLTGQPPRATRRLALVDLNGDSKPTRRVAVVARRQ
jgi:hypothetical protein